MPKMIGRRVPYTEAGIRRVMCARCRSLAARTQWQACAIGNRWLALCPPCDIELNDLTLVFLGVPPHVRAPIIARYQRKVFSNA